MWLTARTRRSVPVSQAVGPPLTFSASVGGAQQNNEKNLSNIAVGNELHRGRLVRVGSGAWDGLVGHSFIDVGSFFDDRHLRIALRPMVVEQTPTFREYGDGRSMASCFFDVAVGRSRRARSECRQVFRANLPDDGFCGSGLPSPPAPRSSLGRELNTDFSFDLRPCGLTIRCSCRSVIGPFLRPSEADR